MDQSRTIRERYPPPWRVKETPGGYVVTCANGNRLAYLYVREERVASAGLTRPEAKAIAQAIARIAMLEDR